MSWIYSQKTGHLISPDGKTVFNGYAGGNCGKNPEGRNNPEMQCVKSVGPLPCGTYTFGTAVDHTHLGPCAIPLIPDKANAMFGRSGFYMHSDTVGQPGCASEGCIVMPNNVRQLCASSKDRTLVVVKGA